MPKKIKKIIHENLEFMETLKCEVRFLDSLYVNIDLCNSIEEVNELIKKLKELILKHRNEIRAEYNNIFFDVKDLRECFKKEIEF